MRTNKTHVDCVVKRILSGLLHDPAKYLPALEKRIEYISKLHVGSSLLVNAYLMKKLNAGSEDILPTLHITSGQGSGDLKQLFRNAMILFVHDDRAPHPNPPAYKADLIGS